MPLLYVPLIMYVSWMEMMSQPFVVVRQRTENDAREDHEPVMRTKA